jgi:hypothetical protein
MEITKTTTCNNSKCKGKGKCLRYKGYLRGTKTNPFKFPGTKKQACTNFISV